MLLEHVCTRVVLTSDRRGLALSRVDTVPQWRSDEKLGRKEAGLRAQCGGVSVVSRRWTRRVLWLCRCTARVFTFLVCWLCRCTAKVFTFLFYRLCRCTAKVFYLLVQVYSMSFTFLFYWLCRCTTRAFTFLCRYTARVSPSSPTDCVCAQQGFYLPLPLLPDPPLSVVIVQVYNKGFTFLFFLLFFCYCADVQQGFHLTLLLLPPPLFLLLCRCAARVSPSSSTSSSSCFSVIVQVCSKGFTFLSSISSWCALFCDCAGVQQGLHLPLLLLPPPRCLLRPGPRHVGLSPRHSGPAWRQRDAVPGGGGAWSGPPAVPDHTPLPAESGCGRATAAGCHRRPLWAAGRCRPHQPPVARLQGHAPPRPRPFSGSRLLPLSPQPRPLGSAPSDQHWRGVFWRPGCYSSRGDGRSEIRHEWIQASVKGKRMDSCFDGPYHGPVCVYRSIVRTTRC